MASNLDNLGNVVIAAQTTSLGFDPLIRWSEAVGSRQSACWRSNELIQSPDSRVLSAKSPSFLRNCMKANTNSYRHPADVTFNPHCQYWQITPEKIQLRWARRRRWQWFMPFYETIAYHCIALNANHIPVFSAESERDQLDQKGSDSGGQQGHHRTASTFWWPHLSGERVATCSLHIQLELEAILGIVYC